MNNSMPAATELFQLGSKISHLSTKRILAAYESFTSSTHGAVSPTIAATSGSAVTDAWQAWGTYATDWVQRRILCWDTLRQRGNNFLEHERAGQPPRLVFDGEMIVDGRELKQPVNDALVRITPPTGVIVDEPELRWITDNLFVGNRLERWDEQPFEVVAEVSEMPADSVRRIKTEQSVVAELEPELGMKSFSQLLADAADRERALKLLDKVELAVKLTTEQRGTLDRIRSVLGAGSA